MGEDRAARPGLDHCEAEPCVLAEQGESTAGRCGTRRPGSREHGGTPVSDRSDRAGDGGPALLPFCLVDRDAGPGGVMGPTDLAGSRRPRRGFERGRSRSTAGRTTGVNGRCCGSAGRRNVGKHVRGGRSVHRGSKPRTRTRLGGAGTGRSKDHRPRPVGALGLLDSGAIDCVREVAARASMLCASSIAAGGGAMFRLGETSGAARMCSGLLIKASTRGTAAHADMI